MTNLIALCIDEACARNPELIGLAGERIDRQDWLALFTSGNEARESIGSTCDASEVWVVSCDDVEPINLAATIKADHPQLRVRLVSGELCGSLMSRAHNAQIDEVLEMSAFLRQYAQAKESHVAETSSDWDFPDEDSGQVPLDDGLEAALSAASHPAAASVAAPSAAPALAPMREGERATLEPNSVIRARLQSSLQSQSQIRPLSVQSANRAFVLSVVSGSGGAGKSSTAALGAVISCRAGHRTLLIDYDLQFGDVDVMVGVENPLRIDTALAHPDDLELMLGRNEPLSVLAAPARLEAAEEVVHQLPRLLDRLADEFDVIIANTGATWAEQHAALLERSSVALFLIDQRASSVRACKHALELCARCGIAANPFQFALNRCAKGTPLTSVDVSCALQGAPVFELKEGGRDVEEYLSGGGASDLIEARNDFARSLDHVMSRLLPGGVVEADALVAKEPSRRLLSRRRSRHRK